MASNNDFVMTIESDDEGSIVPRKTTKSQVNADPDFAQLNPEFSFGISDDAIAAIFPGDIGSSSGSSLTKLEPVSIDDIISRRRLKITKRRKRQGSISDEDDGEEGQPPSSDIEEDPLATDEESDEEIGSESEADKENVSLDNESSSSDSSDEETQAEKDRKAVFFSNAEHSEVHSSFLTMNLSRPITKALTSMGFNTPTPIQAATIPVGLMGKDVVGNAVTGSGKTAAFIIPMIERLLYRERGRRAAATRCLILVPTRELAAQCFEVGTKLAAHTDIQFCLVVGGLSSKTQEAALRNRPDIVIATPGRLIDHIRNSPSFTLDALDILVLDEADRMLSEGFHDELTEIIKSCPSSRQSMLFSATMTDSVDELVKMSLNKPVRLFVDPSRVTAKGLVQEFIRVRGGKEEDRPAILVTICKKLFRSGVIVFFRSKRLAHQMRVVFGLLGMSCEELHGDLTQEQRLKALRAFRDGQADYLMATDLVSRGLDIKGVNTVINYDMPNDLAQYLHRVGRTARAGRKGRSVSLVGEADRKLLKAAVKHSSGVDSVRHRVLSAEDVAKWVQELDGLKGEVADILKEEKEEKQLRQAEMELKKGQNMIEHEEEIYSRPARTWFQSTKDKAKSAVLSKKVHEAGSDGLAKTKITPDENKRKRDKYAGLSRRAKRRKVAMEEDNGGDNKAIGAAVRAAKKAARPAKIGEPERRPKRSRDIKKAKAKSGLGRDFTSGQEMGQSARREGVRAKKGVQSRLNIKNDSKRRTRR
ncbi:DEAD-domain-containing protein [Neolentinus lepideus HHB14362 ss-1]|uniref:RNA helicase n=1 Tax=Neolentinus lepideus HHB14362 ss-1 TaxID=1314782 RepID=A0A165VYP5_9AGAM|nr:DEAD-domain-containing protein [Neolentinus lepideus HHB14362 ss-1]